MESKKLFQEKFSGPGLTFDDVILVPAYSEVLPHEVSIRSQLTRDIAINVPIISAAMDTVTEYQLAIAMARQGGMGFIHKNMTIAEQAEQVRNVKRSESGMIIDPVTVGINAKVSDALALMERYKIGGIPVIAEDGRLEGIITNRDLRFETNTHRPVIEVMTRENLITAPEGTTLEKARAMLQKYKIEKLPVINKKGKLVGLITYKDLMNNLQYPLASKDHLGRLMTGAAVGVTSDMLDRMTELIKSGVDVIVIDTAHGHSGGVLKSIARARKTFKDISLIAGNVATGAGALALAEAGVDGIKVGVGPGSICTTRVVAGIGVPQLTAIHSAAQAVKKRKIPIIGDGGVRYTGDITKALAAGADVIMTGGLFAGTEEAPGETIIYEGRKFKLYRGMGSLGAMMMGSKDRYFQGGEYDKRKLVPEGIEGMVPYKGTVAEVMTQYIGGLRAGMGYCGAANILELKNAQFISITSAGMQEGHPHNVTITKESPNYSRL